MARANFRVQRERASGVGLEGGRERREREREAAVASFN